MPPVSAFESPIYFLSAAGHLILLIKLRVTGLAASYPWLFRFLCFQLAATLITVGLNPRANLFGYVWIPLQATLWVFYYLVVNELYSVVLADYPGIRRLSKRFLQVGAVLCIVLSAASIWAELTRGDAKFPILLAMNTARRSVAFGLLLFLSLMVAYLAYFPVSLKRNTAVHAALCTGYFLTVAVGVFCRNLMGASAARLTSTISGGVTVLMVFGWVFLLTRAGERRRQVVALRLSPKSESEVLERLRSLNDSLLASTRK